MWKQLAAAAVLAAFTAPAFAFSCPVLMGEVDDALADQSIAGTLSDAELKRVRELRQEGEALHNNGDHNASEAALNEALGILDVGDSGGGSGYY